MSLTNAAENSFLLLLFNATTWANIAINASSAPITNIQVSGHSADPGEAGDQTTNEIGYTSYARAAVARTSGGWTITGNSVSPVATVAWPAGTGGSGTITHCGFGTASSGAGVLLCSGTVTPNLTCGNGYTPQLTTATTIVID